MTLPRGSHLVFIATTLGLVPAAAGAQANPAVELRAVRAAVAPKLDGVLDDAAWAGDPLPADGWVSYNPLRGEPAQQRTQVWIVYDEKAIYFAFRCSILSRRASAAPSAGATTSGTTTGLP